MCEGQAHDEVFDGLVGNPAQATVRDTVRSANLPFYGSIRIGRTRSTKPESLWESSEKYLLNTSISAVFT